jgi:hypothetical protein
MDVMPGPAAPPDSIGWLGGGIVDIGLVSEFARVPPGVLLPRFVLWLVSCEGSTTLSTLAAACCWLLASVACASLCTGDECIGDADLLLCESPPPPPPLDEVRGETRPVYMC